MLLLQVVFSVGVSTHPEIKNNRRKTAKALNISERTLYRKLKEYGI